MFATFKNGRKGGDSPGVSTMTRYRSPLSDQYESKFAEYEDFTKGMQNAVKDLMRVERFKKHSIVAIDARTKEVESLDEKIARKGGKYSSLDEITDLSGIRIIACLEEEVDQILSYYPGKFRYRPCKFPRQASSAQRGPIWLPIFALCCFFQG
jgi:ppGpp synthetase/RelA/SpoT-type nucleotidyltranferase